MSGKKPLEWKPHPDGKTAEKKPKELYLSSHPRCIKEFKTGKEHYGTFVSWEDYSKLDALLKEKDKRIKDVEEIGRELLNILERKEKANAALRAQLDKVFHSCEKCALRKERDELESKLRYEKEAGESAIRELKKERDELKIDKTGLIRQLGNARATYKGELAELNIVREQLLFENKEIRKAEARLEARIEKAERALLGSGCHWCIEARKALRGEVEK